MRSILKRWALILSALAFALGGNLTFDLKEAAASPTAEVNGYITDVNGNGLAGWDIQIISQTWQDYYITATSDENGWYRASIQADVYDFKFYKGSDVVWVNNQNIIADTVVSASTTFETRKFSGTLRDSRGNNLTGQTIRLVTLDSSDWESEGTVKTDGSFSLRSKLAANYGLKILNPGVPNSSGISNFSFNSGYGAIDLSSADIYKDLVVDIKTVTVSLKDYDNNPVAGDTISSIPGYGSSVSTTELAPGISGRFGGNTYATTDSNGIAQLSVINGSYYGQEYEAGGPYDWDNICALNTLDNTGRRLCMYTAGLRVTSDTNMLLQPRPLSPTNLVSPSNPSQSLNLNWNASSGATSYNIYRGNTYVASTPTSSFVDENALEGQYDYRVTAVKNDIESLKSNTIYPTVDRTIPTLSYSISTSSPPHASGWYRDAVNVYFTCEDNISGIASCVGSQQVYNDTSGQTVTGTATDRAGNTNSVSTIIKIDRVAPTINSISLNPTTTIRTGNTLTVTANASDVTSGLASGEFYIDTDPGLGSGTPMTLNGTGSQVVGSKTISGLTNGTHTVYVRAKDVAGNWSGASTAVFSFRK